MPPRNLAHIGAVRCAGGVSGCGLVGTTAAGARQFRLSLIVDRLPVSGVVLAQENLRSLAPDLANYDRAAELERGLNILLTGVRATYPHHQAA
jgi:hypothetical protein